MLLEIESRDLDSYTCIKTFPNCPFNVGDKINKDQICQFPDGYFSDPDFFTPNYTESIGVMDMEIEGYKMNVNKDAGNVNWGCRSFTKDEISIIDQAFGIFQRKDLNIGIGRDGEGFTKVNFYVISKLNKYLNK